MDESHYYLRVNTNIDLSSTVHVVTKDHLKEGLSSIHGNLIHLLHEILKKVDNT